MRNDYTAVERNGKWMLCYQGATFFPCGDGTRVFVHAVADRKNAERAEDCAKAYATATAHIALREEIAAAVRQIVTGRSAAARRAINTLSRIAIVIAEDRGMSAADAVEAAVTEYQSA